MDRTCTEQGEGLALDEEMHRYRLDAEAMMTELADILATRGYRATPDAHHIWEYETRWNRGSACGEIGSLLYSLVSTSLRPVDE